MLLRWLQEVNTRTSITWSLEAVEPSMEIDEDSGIWYHSGSGTNALANVGPQPTFFVVRGRAAMTARGQTGTADITRVT